MIKNILVIGKNGQVGSALQEILGGDAVYVDKEEIDLAEPHLIKEKLKKFSPQIIINAAAYTAVDKAEEERDLAKKINADSPKEIAAYAAENNVIIVHYSTDYVFPGTGDKPWSEDSATAPVNYYGETKLLGDAAIINSGVKYLIFRTSWVYDDKGKNFLLTMLQLGKEKEKLQIVDDQIGSPTYAYHIAKYTVAALKKAAEMREFPSGVYNLCNNGYTSWYKFAAEIFAVAAQMGFNLKIKQLSAVKSTEFPRPAKRPLNSRLNLDKIQKTFDIKIPDWETALKECMQRLKK